MRGSYRKREFFDCLSFVSTEVCGREMGHAWKRTDMYCDL